MEWIRKHWVCTFLILLLLVYGVIQFYFHRRDVNDLADKRWYPINITETGKITIEYKTRSYVKYHKCFKLAFDKVAFDKMKHSDLYHDFYLNHSNYYVASSEVFYAETKNKPHFIVKIYKEGVLEAEENLYMMVMSYYANENINDKELSVRVLAGFFGPQSGACHKFLADTYYTIEVINDTPLPEYEGIPTYLGLKHEVIL